MSTGTASESLQGSLPDHSGGVVERGGVMEVYETSPLDEYNIKLLDNVHPSRWQDPQPQGRYNLVVIGAGSGGLVSAAGAAGVGARVALVEMNLLGGDCLNVGCVPSKALIRCARAAYEARNGARFGVQIDGEVKVKFGQVMERMRRLRSDISHHDSAERFSKELGIDVFIGRGEFSGPNSITVNGNTLQFSKCVIAAGASANVPMIPGLKESPYLTNASLFNLTELPRVFGVIGAGPIGLEMAQSFRRFGSEVHVFARSAQILDKEDEDAAAVIQRQFENEGIFFHLNINYDEVKTLEDEPSSCGGDRKKIAVHFTTKANGRKEHVAVDALLVAAGRKPNTSGLGLEKAKIELQGKFIKVNEYLQTTNKSVYAVGDCCHRYQFTHMSDFMARLVIRNALFLVGGIKVSTLIVPWATYTEPEVAHVGLYERDMIARGIKYRTFKREFKDVDRCILEDETEGFVEIHVGMKDDKILGATIVGPHAGDMISEITLAMYTKTGLETIGSVIHPYPTQAEGIRQCGDLIRKTKLTPFVKGLFSNIMAFQR